MDNLDVMVRNPPKLNQAVADANGFTLYSCSHRIWIRLAGFLSVMLAVNASLVYKFPAMAFGLLLLSLGSAATAGWLARGRIEFTLRTDTRVATILEVKGLLPADRQTFNSEEIACVEFGPCRNGRQQVSIFWKDPKAPQIVAMLLGAQDREGDMARSVRKSLATCGVPIREVQGWTDIRPASG